MRFAGILSPLVCDIVDEIWNHVHSSYRVCIAEQEGYCALIKASIKGAKGVLQTLLAAGAFVESQDKVRKTVHSKRLKSQVVTFNFQQMYVCYQQLETQTN